MPPPDTSNGFSSGDAPQSAVRRAALFIDWENLKYSLREHTGGEPALPALVAALHREVGRLAVARAYADWDDYGHRRTNDTMRLYRLGIDPVYVPTRPSPYSNRIVNSVDVKMTADALETSFTHPQIDTFVFVSGDHSLLHPLRSLRMRGIKVFVVGVEGHTSNLLEEQADRVWYYHELAESAGTEDAVPRPSPGTNGTAGPLPPPRPSAPGTATAAASLPPQPTGPEDKMEEFLRLVVQLIRERRANNGIPLLSYIGAGIKARLPGFQPGDLGPFERLIDLVEYAEKQGRVRIILSNGHKAVVLPDDPLIPTTGKAPAVANASNPLPPPLSPSPATPEGVEGATEPVPVAEQLSRFVELVREKRVGSFYPQVAGLGGLFMQRFPSFRATDYGMQRFNDLVELAAERGMVRIVGRANARFVLLPGDPTGMPLPATDDFAAPLSDEDRAVRGEISLPDGDDAVGNGEAMPPPTLDDVIGVLTRLVAQAERQDREAPFTRLGADLQRILPGYRPENHGFARFGELMEHARSIGALRIVWRDNNRHVAILPDGLLQEGDREIGPGDGGFVPLSRLTPDALPRHPQTLARIVGRAATIEQDGGYYTVSHLARDLSNAGIRFPATMLATERSGAETAAAMDTEAGDAAATTGAEEYLPTDLVLSLETIKQVLRQAVRAGIFMEYDASISPERTVIAIRLNREHPAVAAVIDAPPLEPDDRGNEDDGKKTDGDETERGRIESDETEGDEAEGGRIAGWETDTVIVASNAFDGSGV